ncbi:ABC transporter permease [Enterococcus sp. MJM12]|uniref:ABC transporter permease n=1 Tax=Candidatus Enterococcus myersii TaxID=2815322 RepID=A0ABS3HBE5_9ENTE|nr:ABC transporter permease [Enterococcus sp. MJM12]MBO0450347.1 ABC transporter permease [Enterococcus sp. MJM12]
MSKFWVIAKDVYKKNVKSVSFLILILAPFLMGAFYYFTGQLAGSSDVNTIGVYSDDAALGQAFTQLDHKDYDFKVIPSKKAAEKDLAKEKLDAFLVLTNKGDSFSGEIFTESSLGQTTQLMIQQLLTQMQSNVRAKKMGLSAQEVGTLSQTAQLTTQKVSFDKSGTMTSEDDHSSLQMIVTNVSAIILFIFVVTYSSIIAQEIASEKGTRIMEVILSSTKAQTHFYGKLTGVLLVALTQLLIYGLMIIFGYQKFKDMDIVRQFLGDASLESLFGPFLIFSAIFVILGILLYAVLAALCGSLVNKAEDTSKAIIPVTYLSMGAYFLALFVGMFDPQNIALKICSYIPFFSSFAMPVRLANDTASISSAIVSVVILAVFTVFLMLISSGLYKSNVLVYNENGVIAALKQSLSMMKAEKK